MHILMHIIIEALCAVLTPSISSFIPHQRIFVRKLALTAHRMCTLVSRSGSTRRRRMYKMISEASEINLSTLFSVTKCSNLVNCLCLVTSGHAWPAKPTHIMISIQKNTVETICSYNIRSVLFRNIIYMV